MVRRLARSSNRRGGFTLLEVLLSSAIGVLLLGGLYVAVEVQYRQIHAGQQAGKQATLASRLLSKIASDIAGELCPTLPTPATSSSTTTNGAAAAGAATPATNVVVINNGVLGDQQDLILTGSRMPSETLKPDILSTGTPIYGTSDVHRVMYWVAQGDGGLARFELKTVTDPNQSAYCVLPPAVPDEASYIIAPEVKSIQFSYFDGTSWNDTWDGSQPSQLANSDGVTPQGPPLAIAVVIGIQTDDHDPQNSSPRQHEPGRERQPENVSPRHRHSDREWPDHHSGRHNHGSIIMRHPLYRNRRRLARKAQPRRRGFVLVAVLLVVVVLALSAYQFSRSMTAEYGAADSLRSHGQGQIARQVGHRIRHGHAQRSQQFQTTLGSNPYDNTAAFQAIVVQPSDKKFENGRFDIVGPPDYDSAQQGISTQHYGVIDEGGKMNINALFKLDSSGKVLNNFLMTLPNMTQDVADAIVDWIDPDDDTTGNGAESDYYSGLSPSYQAKNGPLDSVEELLLVKGVTPQLLFGNDQNRNGILDPGEDDGTGALDQGWSAFITVFSRERNLSSQNVPHININGPDLTTLIDQLSGAVGEEMAAYIIGYRLYSGSSSGSSTSGDGGTAGRGGGGGGRRGTTTPAPAPTPSPSPSPTPPGRPGTPQPTNTPGGCQTG